MNDEKITNAGYDPFLYRDSNSITSIKRTDKPVKAKVPETLAAVSIGCIFTGTLHQGDTWWKGTFINTGGATVMLEAPGAWFRSNDTCIKVTDYEQVDLEIKVVPHVS